MTRIPELLKWHAILLATAVVLAGEVPQVQTIEPRNAKPGSVISVTGISLEKTKVDDAFLTDHRFDLKVKVLEQTPTSMKFRIPPFIKPGRHQLLLQTAGDTPKLLEQPVYVTIDVEDVQIADKKDAEKDKEKGSGTEKGAANSEKQP